MYIIWNLTRLCPWNCEFCCVSAICSKSKNGAEKIHQKEIKDKRQLTFKEKDEILKIISAKNLEIDFSGGDPLYLEDDIKILEKAILIMPKEKIDISMTGVFIDARKINILKQVNKVEFTLDNLEKAHNPLRPNGFNISTMKVIPKLISRGINASAVTILHKHTASKDNLRTIYKWLCKNRVKSWSVLKFYPVGRGESMKNMLLTKDDYLEIMDFLNSLKGYTEIIFQHSLRILNGSYTCHAAVETVGILPDGTVLACAWALKNGCLPINGFKIGKLPEDNFDAILKKAQEEMGYQCRCNFCRITKQ